MIAGFLSLAHRSAWLLIMLVTVGVVVVGIVAFVLGGLLASAPVSPFLEPEVILTPSRVRSPGALAPEFEIDVTFTPGDDLRVRSDASDRLLVGK